VAQRKIRVLPNADEVEALTAPSSFDRDAFRQNIGISKSDVTFVFIALGHFERKGLALLIEALARPGLETANLLVIGGAADLIESYRSRAEGHGVKDRIVFAGMQSDVRPFLWAADAFVLASAYETFSLVTFEAAGASLPLITPLLHGIEEIARDGVTGYLVGRTVDEFVRAMRRFVELPISQRAEMGRQARLSALQFDEKSFVDNWRRFYDDWMDGRTSKGRLHRGAQPFETLS
jgi:glycosyltransferase involved in cell wall biosynthesis